jgi:hypothetical protein
MVAEPLVESNRHLEKVEKPPQAQVELTKEIEYSFIKKLGAQTFLNLKKSLIWFQIMRMLKGFSLS